MNNQSVNKCPVEFKLTNQDIELLKKFKEAYNDAEKESNSMLANRIKHSIDCDIKKLHRQKIENKSV